MFYEMIPHDAPLHGQDKHLKVHMITYYTFVCTETLLMTSIARLKAKHKKMNVHDPLGRIIPYIYHSKGQILQALLGLRSVISSCISLDSPWD